MNDNIVVASFTDARHETRTRRIYQYDYGMVLQVDGITLPTAFEAHFSNTDDSGTSVTQIGSDGAVTIPDAYLLTGLPVYCWIYLHSGEDDGETVYKITIPVKRRAQPTNEEPTPVQQDAITQAIAALNSAVTQTGEDAESAEASASDAADSAEEAKGYKEDAETAAGNAADSATAAGASATQAARSASNAAEGARLASSSAQQASIWASLASESAQKSAQSAQAAQASARSIQSMSVEAETLAPGSQATAEWDSGTLTLGIPKGDKGLKGDPGDPGDPGFSPTATVSKSGNATTLTVTDETGTTTATILDGAKGDPGDPGTSPTASVSKSGNKSTITITDDEGTTTAEVLDGEKGDPGASPTIAVSDIPGGHRVTITDADHPGGISFDVMDGTDADAPVKGVTINGTSIVDAQGNADIPIMDSSNAGVAKITSTSGLQMDGDILKTRNATSDLCKAGANNTRVIVPANQDASVFYGLAKVAGANMASSSQSTIGTYPEAQKSAIQNLIGGAITISGTTPTINALPGLRYICGEVSTLTVNLPASGCVDITFESGSTPTVLTVNPATGQTVKWANGFDPTALEADTVYEINVADGLGVMASWTA